MRQVNIAALLAAAEAIKHPERFVGPTGAQVLEAARQMVARHSARLSTSVHPAELERRARQRRRAAITHPGKRA